VEISSASVAEAYGTGAISSGEMALPQRQQPLIVSRLFHFLRACAHCFIEYPMF
jgi:hypothetical protein